jgi:hypothetical protein
MAIDASVLATQEYPAILLQIERYENTIRRRLLSTENYCEHFRPILLEDVSDTQWCSLVLGMNEAFRLKQRTIHIDDEKLVNAILTKNILTDSINTKYYNRMFMDLVAKRTGLRAYSTSMGINRSLQ